MIQATVILTPAPKRWNVALHFSLTSFAIGANYQAEPGLDSFVIYLPFVEIALEYIHASYRNKMCICKRGIIECDVNCRAHKDEKHKI